MDCIVCKEKMSYYFTKHFGEFGLSNVDYYSCPGCGFVGSKTHFDLSKDKWETLNSNYHSVFYKRTDNPYNIPQKRFKQAQMIYLMNLHGILPDYPYLDWGCGLGYLSLQLHTNFNLTLKNYDKYQEPMRNRLAEEDLTKGNFNLVLSSAVLEHLRSREELDNIESLVSQKGCFAFHTLVRGTIPKDPEWMYLLPVHCAFFTNESMSLLMKSWGYNCSVYNEFAKMWIWFRDNQLDVNRKVSALNELLGWEYLHFKEGFMDFWP